MRRAIILLAVAVVGCSKSSRDAERDQSSAQRTTFEARESADMQSAPPMMRDVAAPAAVEAPRGAPNIGMANVPGMSLSYQYGFRVPIEHIAAVQEAHASACEAMTPYRCRITGMTYDTNRNRTISATLQMKLAPADARAFGKNSVDTVNGAGGMLDHSRIDSEESGQAIADANRQQASVEEQRQQINQQLARPGLKSWEREQLQAQLADLANQKRAAQDIRADAQRKLASTPMSFSYDSGDVDPGFSDGPVLGALKDGWGNIVAGFAVFLMVFVTVLPWLVGIAVLLLGGRRFGDWLAARQARIKAEAGGTVAPPPPPGSQAP